MCYNTLLIIFLDSFKSLINDKFAWKIKPDDSTWSLFPADHIHVRMHFQFYFLNKCSVFNIFIFKQQIFIEKQDERWWENLLENEEKLDLKTINPEKPMEELDEESQAKIKQMMFDDRQKKLGLPTSEEQASVIY